MTPRIAALTISLPGRALARGRFRPERGRVHDRSAFAIRRRRGARRRSTCSIAPRTRRARRTPMAERPRAACPAGAEHDSGCGPNSAMAGPARSRLHRQGRSLRGGTSRCRLACWGKSPERARRHSPAAERLACRAVPSPSRSPRRRRCRARRARASGRWSRARRAGSPARARRLRRSGGPMRRRRHGR